MLLSSVHILCVYLVVCSWCAGAVCVAILLRFVVLIVVISCYEQATLCVCGLLMFLSAFCCCFDLFSCVYFLLCFACVFLLCRWCCRFVLILFRWQFINIRYFPAFPLCVVCFCTVCFCFLTYFSYLIFWQVYCCVWSVLALGVYKPTTSSRQLPSPCICIAIFTPLAFAVPPFVCGQVVSSFLVLFDSSQFCCFLLLCFVAGSVAVLWFLLCFLLLFSGYTACNNRY